VDIEAFVAARTTWHIVVSTVELLLCNSPFRKIPCGGSFQWAGSGVYQIFVAKDVAIPMEIAHALMPIPSHVVFMVYAPRK